MTKNVNSSCVSLQGTEVCSSAYALLRVCAHREVLVYTCSS